MRIDRSVLGRIALPLIAVAASGVAWYRAIVPLWEYSLSLSTEFGALNSDTETSSHLYGSLACFLGMACLAAIVLAVVYAFRPRRR
jgi:hypothetical protein